MRRLDGGGGGEPGVSPIGLSRFLRILVSVPTLSCPMSFFSFLGALGFPPLLYFLSSHPILVSWNPLLLLVSKSCSVMVSLTPPCGIGFGRL